MTYGELSLDGHKMMDAIKVPSATYHLDVFVGLTDREKMIKEHPFFRVNYFFTTDGDPRTMAKFKELGVNAHYIPAASSKEECYIAPAVKDLTHDIVFIGSRIYHREYPYRGVLIEYLRSVYKKRFCLYPEDRNMPIQSHQLNQLCSSSKIVIGDSFGAGDKKNYWSNRITETTAHGGFLIHPRVEGLEDHYTDKEDLVLYDHGDFRQLGDLIDYYLAHDEERETIRRNGMLKTKANHTFDNVIEEMFKVMGIE